MRRGTKGDDLEALQKTLNLLSFNAGNEDGDFRPNTEKAVRAFQTKARISIDGKVYTKTWKGLARQFDQTIVYILGENTRLKLANFTENEASKNSQWVNSSSKAEKYLLFRKTMLKFYKIGTTKVL